MAVKLTFLALCVALCHAGYIGSPKLCPPSFSGYVPHDTDPSLYLACHNGEVALRKCRTHHVFDSEHKRCINPTLVNPSADTEKGLIPELGPTYPNGCPVDYYVTYLTPHSDCSLYYSCVSGKKVEQNCFHGLLFSYEHQACVWAWETNCGEGNSGDSSPDLSSESDGSVEEIESAVPELGETHSNGCPIDYYITYLTPHRDCGLYYSCVHGSKVAQTCWPGLVFSYHRQTCVWPWESNCEGGSSGGSPPDSGTEPESPEEPESAIPDLGETYPNGCPIDYYITYHTPHPICSLFYTCVHGDRVVQNCSRGLSFSYRQQACVWPWESDCSGGNGGGSPPGPGAPDIPEQPEPESAVPELGETHENGCPIDYYITYLTPHENCGLFYSCVHGSKVPQKCVPGLLFSYRQQACVWPWESECEGGSAGGSPPDAGTEPDSSESGSAIPDLGETYPNGCPKDYYITYLTPHPVCSRFYTCVHGDKVAQDCVSGLHFNYNLQACVWPWESDCTGSPGGGSSPSEPGSSEPEPESAVPELGETHENGCPVDYYITYHMPHQDCGHFYTCVHGNKVSQQCVPGLLFSYRRQECVWPWESDCDGSSSGGAPPGSESETEPESAVPELGETHANGCPIDYYITYLMPHEDCSRFYTCVHGNKVAQSCQRGLSFDYNRQACVWPWETDCTGGNGGGTSPGSGSESESSENDSDSNESDSNEEDGSGGSSGGGSAVPDLGETHANGCPRDYLITYLTPHEDCGLYYSCVHGRKVVQTCWPGLVFSYDRQACVWPWESNCEGGSSGGSPPDSGSEPDSPEETESAIPDLGETYPNGCPIDYHITYHTPHPICSLFYTCVHGDKVVQECSRGLSFSYRQQACVWPWESDCEGGTGGGTEPGTPDVPDVPEPESAVPELGETYPNGCPRDYKITYHTSHENCGLFYTCVHGGKVQQKCVPGLLFSYRRQACVWPWESECEGGSAGGSPPDAGTEPDSSESGSAIPDLGETYPNGCPKDYYITYLTPHPVCSRFYTCVHGEKVAQDCATGLHFNYDHQACVWPWESDCTGSPGGGGSPSEPDSSEPEPDSAVPELGETHANGCPVDYYITYHMPHRDCGHFYTCVHGNKVQQQCVPGLLFSYRRQTCVWPWESDCDGSTSGGAPPGSESEPEPESAVPELGETHANGCPIDYYITYLMPHEDCSRFYTCVHGDKVAQSCQRGLSFDYNRQACVWPWETDCVGGSGGGTSPGSGSESESSEENSDSNESEDNGSGGSDGGGSAVPDLGETHANGCPRDYLITYLTPHEDCGLYYSCVHGGKVVQTCWPGLVFSYDRQACVWPWESNCEGGSSGGSPPESGSEPDSPEEPESAIPDLGETYPNGCPIDYYITYHTPHPICSLFYTCVHGDKVVQNCSRGLSFSYRQQACVWPWESDCAGGSGGGTEPDTPDVPDVPEPESAVPELGETHPNGCPIDSEITYHTPHENCGLFYTCVHGSKVPQKCVPGLLFSYRQQACVWPWESECEGGSAGGSPPDAGTEPDSSESGSAIPDLGETYPNGCPKDYYITYLTPHPVCSRFYTCVHGEMVAQDCARGLHFNYNLQACVWPWESDCTGSPGEGGSPSEPGPTDPEPESAVPELGETYPNGCPKDDFITYLMPHRDCGLFYSCVHGNKVEQRCVPGLLFSYRQQNCVWPWESDCSGGSGGGSPPDGSSGNSESEPESAIPDLGETHPNGCPIDYYITYLTPHEDCSRFYTCVHGDKIAQSCQHGLFFDYNRQACVWPWQTDCTNESGGGGSPDPSSESESSESESDSNESEEDGSGGSVEEPGSAVPDLGETYPNGCPKNYLITYLTPHEDCGRYYSCVHGKKVVQTCWPGLVFNYDRQACVWPWESDCEGSIGGGSPPDSGSGPDSPEDPDTPDQPSVIPDLGETYPNGCPIDYRITYLTPHRVCSLFYSCVHGDKVVQKCDRGLHFNYRLQACIWPWESDCSGSSGGGSPPDSGTEPENPGAPDVPVYPEPEPSIPDLGETYANGCPKDYFITYLTPHDDCGLYYSCVHGQKVAQKCIPGLLFSYEQQSCVWPWESNCEGGSVGGSPPDAGTHPENPDHSEPDSAIPDLGETYPNGCPTDYYITYLTPHPVCSSYYSCVHGDKITENCQHGLFFNYRQQACVWPWESDCAGDVDGGSPSEPSNPNIPGPAQPEPESAIPELGETYPNGCPIDYYITYLTPHEDCGLYYSCDNGKKIPQKCIPGLLFGYKQQACVWPWESDCSGDSVGNPPDAGSEPDSPAPVQPEPESAIPELGEVYQNGCPVDYYITYLMPHQDCSLYYTCLYGEKVAQNCQRGLSFHYRQQACVWPWESDCRAGVNQPEPGNPEIPDVPAHPEPESAIPELGETYPNGCPIDYYIDYLTPHEDCGLYYSCVYGKKVTQKCVPGLLFSYRQQACVWPWESNCKAGSQPDQGAQPENPETPDIPVQPQPESAIPELGETYPNGCPVDYYITYLTPHPDCTSYYTCIYGEKLTQHCQLGLLFNYRQQACVWPWESDCSSEGNQPDHGSQPGIPVIPVLPEPESAVPELGETYPNGCPIDYYVTYLTSHPDCNQYYSCVYGKKVAQKCIPGLLFSYRQQACVWSWETDCVSGVDGEDSSDDSAESGDPIVVHPEPDSAIPGLGDTYPNGCPIDIYITYLTPHPDCSSYYTCVNGEKVTQKCQLGLYFNYRQQACVWPWETTCSDSNLPGTDVEPVNPGVPPQPDSAIPELGETYSNGCPVDYHITYHTPHNICSLYYTCVNGDKIEQNCQPGLLFSFSQQRCVWPEESDCTSQRQLKEANILLKSQDSTRN